MAALEQGPSRQVKAKPKATEALPKVSKAELSELYRMTDAQFTAWQDELSRKEYSISGLCQKCQNKVFGGGEE